MSSNFKQRELTHFLLKKPHTCVWCQNIKNLAKCCITGRNVQFKIMNKCVTHEKYLLGLPGFRCTFPVLAHVQKDIALMIDWLRDPAVLWEKSVAHWIPRDPTFVIFSWGSMPSISPRGTLFRTAQLKPKPSRNISAMFPLSAAAPIPEIHTSPSKLMRRWRPPSKACLTKSSVGRISWSAGNPSLSKCSDI
jgi:hypothetical protein